MPRVVFVYPLVQYKGGTLIHLGNYLFICSIQIMTTRVISLHDPLGVSRSTVKGAQV